MSPASITLDADRTVAAPIGTVRAELERCLRTEGFTIAGEQATVIEATRGSQLAAAAFQHDRLPIKATLRFAPDSAGCRVTVHLEERMHGPTRYLGVHAAYQTAFGALQATIDAGLGRVDARVALSPPVFNSTEAPVAAMEQVGGAAGRAGRKVFGRANRFLEGRGKSVPVAWRGVEQVVLTSSEGHAVVDLEVIRAMLVVANLVSEHPGALPPKLTRDVDAFATRIESSLDSAGGAETSYFAVTDEELPVVKFLATQAAIRQQLPLRTLHVCTTCHLEKVTNPDYERLQARNRRLRGLTSGLGATVGKSGVSAFVVVGQLMKLKKLDPDYVCTRCQSLDADTMVVTFCPDCGERRQEPVLRACPKCKHDFRKGVLPEFWTPGPPQIAQQSWAPQVPAQIAQQSWAPQAPAQIGSGAAAPTDAVIPSPLGGDPIPVPPGARRASPAEEAPLGVGTAAAAQAPAWYPDPAGRWVYRWWDGTAWSGHVASQSAQGVDPL